MILTLRVGVALQELQVLDLDRRACAGSCPTMRGTGLGCPERSSADAGIVDVDALERGGETIGIALAANLAVGDDVEAGVLLRLDRHDRRVVLRLGQEGLGDPPEFARAHARRKSPGELLAVDQPFRLRIAAHERGRKQHGPPFCLTDRSSASQKEF